MKAKRLVVVDDDYKIRELLKTYLEKNNYQVDVAADGESFLTLFRQTPDISLVVLDIMLPGQDGFSVCQKVRAVSDVPIIMLTANAEETDRVVGLEMGADDYIAKPFSPRELLARIKAIHRRYEPMQHSADDGGRYYRFRGHVLDGLERTLTLQGGQPESISGADFQLLKLFLDHAGDVLSRSYLMKSTRGRDLGPLDRYLDVQISRLRTRLSGSDSSQLIKTVRGQGYVFTADVERLHAPD
ncbi:response regulator [Saccharospirillum mangrovi]|uniref:response regulator n=1 Tax=Saccharospirillum mangrovi TaxID=2161747 RepID=UPI000D38BEF6|nr:response regulator transcription factor [Saccharospirillum mangrovi]